MPSDEPVGRRRGMVEPALWGRRHMGSTPSHQGVCGRHGGEERQRPREAWYRPSGRYGRNRATLADERARNRQRKARPEAPDGRGGYKRKRRSDRSGARSRIGARYSGTGSEQKAPDRCRTSSDAGRIQKTDRRGKAPCCVAASTNDARVSTWRKGGQVRNAKDPAPASRRPARRPQTLGDRKSRSSPVKGDDHTGKRLAGKPHEPFERADGGRATARPPPTLRVPGSWRVRWVEVPLGPGPRTDIRRWG